MILYIWAHNGIFCCRLWICNIQNSFTIRTLILSWCRRGQLNFHCTMGTCNGGHDENSVTIHLVIDPTTVLEFHPWFGRNSSISICLKLQAGNWVNPSEDVIASFVLNTSERIVQLLGDFSGSRTICVSCSFIA